VRGRSQLIMTTAALALCAACGGGDDGDVGPESARWTPVFEGLDAALISVGGTSSDDVWTVGADMRDGGGALVLHYDGERWTRKRAGTERDLWWVHAQARDEVFMGGAGGTIVHYDGERFEVMDTPGTATVFGVWGASPDEVWAVGGEPDIAPGFVWRYDGSAWHDLTEQLPAQAGERALFKVWGRGADDVWFVGMDGLALHWDGTAFEQVDAGTTRRLFTVHGAPQRGAPIVAVGGFGTAVIVEHDGTRWHNATPEARLPELFGVHMIDAERGFAVGHEGLVLERSGEAWNVLDTGFEPFEPFHAVWVDPDGGVWCVGGEMLTATPNEGMLLHRGQQAIAHDIDD
jgi:hypothetical protein